MGRAGVAPFVGKVALVAALASALPRQAMAHASDRGFVLLLPTGHYILGGAVAVAASFAGLVVLRHGVLDRLARLRLPLGRLPIDGRTAASLLSFALLAILVLAGLVGSRDPLSNPLPLSVWTLCWIGLTLVCGVFGNVFSWMEPWRGTLALIGRLRPPPATLSYSIRARAFLARIGYLPAILQIAAFAWFELVYPAPDDPERLARVVAVYWVVNFAAMLLFGHRTWTKKGECFSVFFRLVSRLGIVQRRHSATGSSFALCLPGGKLHGIAPLPATGVLFLLAVLASVSFDGLMRTFSWLALVGINPLEFPGRSAVMGVGTLGLLAMIVALASAFVAAVWLGERLARRPVSLGRASGMLVWSIVPIALAYHFSHYLIALLVNGQYALVALSDPFSLGWDLFGTANRYVEAGLVMGPRSAWVLWNIQSAAIVGGHVFAVLIAHGMASRLHPDPRDALASQVPLTILMVLYTVFGLWLLSSPTGA